MNIFLFLITLFNQKQKDKKIRSAATKKNDKKSYKAEIPVEAAIAWRRSSTISRLLGSNRTKMLHGLDQRWELRTSLNGRLALSISKPLHTTNDISNKPFLNCVYQSKWTTSDRIYLITFSNDERRKEKVPPSNMNIWCSTANLKFFAANLKFFIIVPVITRFIAVIVRHPVCVRHADDYEWWMQLNAIRFWDVQQRWVIIRLRKS